MLSLGALLQFAVLAGFVLALTLALLIWALQGPLLRVLSNAAPAQRARLAWWMLVTPALAGTAYCFVTIAMPTLLHESASFTAACSDHAGSLWHLCTWHPSENGQSPWLWGVLALLVVYTASLVGRAVAGLWRIRQTLATVLRLSLRAKHSDDFDVLDIDQPLAVACGIGRGRVLLSRSLLESLDPLQLRVVLAHEKAHLAHRDVLFHLIAAALSSIQLPGTRRRLLRELELALEQRCDVVAAKVVGSSLTVAETIVAVERLFRRYATLRLPITMAFISDFVPERVQALLAPDQHRESWLGAMLGCLVIAFCVLSAGWLHHLTESLIAMVAR